MDASVATLLGAGIALLAALVMGPLMIPLLTRLKVGQNIRMEGPQRHYKKAGTPTMGGIIIITAVMLATFIMAGSSEESLAALLVMLAFGGLGFWDDYIKVVLKRSLGLRAREKLGLQVIISVLFGILLLVYFHRGTQIPLPFTDVVFHAGPVVYIIFLLIVLISASNAVNLTDGLDGLAAGVTFIVAAGYAVVCLVLGHEQLAVFCGALMGACLGFLAYNRHPARVFMGDTGSMALGGAVAAVAALTRTELLLVIIGGVYVVETLSVIIQVVSFQATGKRPFLMAPLHHHFELKGWHETRVVKMFWAIALIFTVIGLLGLFITGS